MIFRFLLLSDEIDNFKREIKINSSATFLDFYKAIIACTGFSDSEMASFFISDNSWRKHQEITLVEMDTDSDVDAYVMEDAVLDEFLEDEKQKLMFVFDYLNERALYIELAEIIIGKDLKSPQCTLSVGDAPAQTRSFDEVRIDTSVKGDLGESFYGDESFDMDELDREGFDGLDELPADIESGDLF